MNEHLIKIFLGSLLFKISALITILSFVAQNIKLLRPNYKKIEIKTLLEEGLAVIPVNPVSYHKPQLKQ